MKKTFILMLLVVLAAVVSCHTTQESTASINGEWEVKQLNGKDIAPAEGETPYLGFDKDNVYGFTGCNQLTGTINVKAFLSGRPDFSHLGMTRMLCHGTYEEEFMAALGKVKKSEVGDETMKLSDGRGNVLVLLKKK